MKRFYLFYKYLKNNRINDYEEIIKRAIENNYEIISLRDYIEKKFNNTKKILILRHDIDEINKATKLMFEIERKYGVTSSFYFRNSTYEPDLMKEIENYGSEASLHFETIADFIKANNIKTKEELFNIPNWKERCLNILKSDIEKLRNILNIPCITIASHGEVENRKIGIPNNYLTEDISVYDFLKIKLEAYNKNFIKEINCYISDCDIIKNEGFRYGISPIEAFKYFNKILFLSHPNHWYYNPIRKIKKMIMILIKGPIRKKEGFRRI